MSQFKAIQTPNRKFFFWIMALGTLSALTAAFLFNHFLNLQQGEILSEARLRLSQAVLAMTEKFNRSRWIQARGETVLRKFHGKPFSASTASEIGQGMLRIFPYARIYTFDPEGRLVFQGKPEPQKSREALWEGVQIHLFRISPDERDKARLAKALSICRGFYGSLTELSDLASADHSPQKFIDKGVKKVSWVIPQTSLDPTETGGKGGAWVVIDPEDLPVREIGADAIREKSGAIDKICIMRSDKGKLKMEVAKGMEKIPAGVAKSIFRNQTEVLKNGLWISRYIPAENGRYMVGAMAPERLEGFLGKNRMTFALFFLFFLASLMLFSYKAWWMGQPLPIAIRPQIGILFFITAILPLFMLLAFGLTRAREAETLERGRWENLIFSTLLGIDTDFETYKTSQNLFLRKVEEVLARALVRRDDLKPLFRFIAHRWEKTALMAMDIGGKIQTLGSIGIPLPQALSDPPKVFLARALELGGRKVPQAFLQYSAFVKEENKPNIYSANFRTRDRINQLQLGPHFFFSRHQVLYREREILGLVVWVFEKFAFTRPFLNRLHHDSQKGRYSPISIAVHYRGRIFPESYKGNSELQEMILRAATFRSNETGLVTIDGKRYLAGILSPENLSGFEIIGLVDASRLDDARLSIMRFLALLMVWSYIWIAAATQFLSRRLVERLTALISFVEKISQGLYKTRTLVSAKDELGVLALTFNQMAEKLEHREHLRQFVSDQVLDEVKKSDAESLALGGQKVPVAVLFSHVHSFDTLLETTSPEALISLLNDYFSLMNPAIEANQGKIDKLIGDAIMAVFFDLPGFPHPARRAFHAATLIQARMEEFNPGILSDGHSPWRTDIGVHYGTAISGKVGSRVGRIDFTVIGDTVNTAARLCAAAARQAESSIVFSEEVKTHLHQKPGFKPLEHIVLKGKSQALELFSWSDFPKRSSGKKNNL